MKHPRIVLGAVFLFFLLASAAFAIDGTMVVYHDGTTTNYPLDEVRTLSWNADQGIVVHGTTEDAYPISSLRKITFEGVTSVPETGGTPIPGGFTLGRAYPNPFNASVTLPISLPVSGTVDLRVVNLLGRQVLHRSLTLAAGNHHVSLNARDGGFGGAASGIYLVRAQYASQAQTQKVIFLK